MATTACVVPVMSTLTSCGNTRLSELAGQIKDSAIQTFMSICKTTHRDVWNEQEGFDFVVKTMQSLGYSDYAGRDFWSFVPEVRTIIQQETGKDPKDPTSKYPNYGNIWYDIEPSKGMENAPKIILQSHLDSQMTFADAAAELEWIKNGINVTFDRDNDILHTDGKTSLGADGGMGMALLLAIAKYEKNFKHGGIRLLFTAGESEATNKYAAGASFLYNDQLKDGYEIDPDPAYGNLRYLDYGSKKPFGDKKDEFVNLISISGLYNKTIYRSVGGIKEMSFSDSELILNKNGGGDIKENNTINLPNLYTITIDNLHGGKSSKDIDSGYANALEMMMKTLNLGKSMQITDAYSLPGAYNIAKTASCTFFSNATIEELNAKKDAIINEFKPKCPGENWNNVKFEIKKIDSTAGYYYALSQTQSENLIKLFAEDVQFGATEWFDTAKKSVKTSYNHGKLSLHVNQTIAQNSSLEFYLVCRSNVKETIDQWGMRKVPEMLETRLMCLYDTDPQSKVVKHTNAIENPAWEGTNPNKLIDTLAAGYKQFGLTANVTESHGWVEVSAFAKAINEIESNIDMAVLGVEINNSQEESETVYTDSLNTLNKALLYSLENIDKTV